MIETRFGYGRGAPEPREQLGDAAKRIVGYAAVFYSPALPGTQFTLYGEAVERIMPGAFDRALREDDVRALFNHDKSQLLGRTAAGTLRLAADAAGLRYEVSPDPDTELTRRVLSYLRRGEVTGSSFGFLVTDERWRQEGGLVVREVLGVRLYDVGPVTFPAYPGTTAAAERAAAPDAPRAAPTGLAARLRQYEVTARLAELGL